VAFGRVRHQQKSLLSEALSPFFLASRLVHPGVQPGATRVLWSAYNAPTSRAHCGWQDTCFGCIIVRGSKAREHTDRTHGPFRRR
jgi:hypothetical protein